MEKQRTKIDLSVSRFDNGGYASKIIKS